MPSSFTNTVSDDVSTLTFHTPPAVEVLADSSLQEESEEQGPHRSHCLNKKK